MVAGQRPVADIASAHSIQAQDTLPDVTGMLPHIETPATAPSPVEPASFFGWLKSALGQPEKPVGAVRVPCAKARQGLAAAPKDRLALDNPFSGNDGPMHHRPGSFGQVGQGYHGQPHHGMKHHRRPCFSQRFRSGVRYVVESIGAMLVAMSQTIAGSVLLGMSFVSIASMYFRLSTKEDDATGRLTILFRPPH